MKKKIIELFPGVVKMKSMARSYWHHYSATLPSYSQYKEDVFILQQLSKYDLSSGVYVDVGGNQPTRLSNTYLLYRHGMSGVVIEPNRELLDFFSQIRPRDIAVNVGAGSSPSMLKFQILNQPARGSFGTNTDDLKKNKIKVLRTEYVPVMPLDNIMVDILENKWISFLSIDTEGMDYEVLSGAKESLKKTLYVCVEANDDVSEKRIIEFLSGDFDMVNKFHCNLIFKNKNPLFEKYLSGR